MPEDGGTGRPFDVVVAGLRRLGDEELMAAWRANDAALEQATRGHDLRLRHYAFRVAAVERFGARGHVERRRSSAGSR